MAFLDDIGRKLTQAGQSAMQKTKDMTDIARLNGLISDEEKAINNAYYQIGKLYVTMHQSDYESDFAGMISNIISSESKIKEYRQQIQDIKGIIHCEKCGGEVPMTAAFCNICGAAVPKQPGVGGPTMAKCSSCGAAVPENTRFCTTCGKPMFEASAAPAAAPESPATVLCPTCNATLAAEAVFCTECGAKIK